LTIKMFLSSRWRFHKSSVEVINYESKQFELRKLFEEKLLKVQTASNHNITFAEKFSLSSKLLFICERT